MIADYGTLMEKLINAARPCFTDVDRDFVDRSIGAGENFYAADDALNAAIAHNFALPADLVAEVRTWFDGAQAQMPARDSKRFGRLIGSVKTCAHSRGAPLK